MQFEPALSLKLLLKRISLIGLRRCDSMSNKQARIKSMKNTTFESAMNSSSFASTESAAKKNEPLMCIKAIDKVKLYYEIWQWLENCHYWELSDAMYNVYYYYVVAERNIKISINNDIEHIIAVDGKKLIGNSDVDYQFISQLLRYGRRTYINLLRKYKDESLNYLKEFVENSCKEDLSDADEAAIVKIEAVLKAEKSKINK